jgi:hypothetical protein
LLRAVEFAIRDGFRGVHRNDTQKWNLRDFLSEIRKIPKDFGN